MQATVRSRAQWDAARESFIKEVWSRPLVVVRVADDPALAADLRQLDQEAVVR
ncbi:MAG: hypothetical protein M3P53_04720 [Actinomycetota bacterium]|nr:hypothetical protein [Actinomycetota bacterium]